MGIRFSGMLLAVVTTAFVIGPGLSASAQFNVPGFGGSNTSDRMGGGGGGKGATGKLTGSHRMEAATGWPRHWFTQLDRLGFLEPYRDRRI